MTPQHVTTIELNELKEIELRCECRTSVRMPLPLKSGNVIAAQDCPGCGRKMWEGVQHPVRILLQDLLSAIDNWQRAGNPVLSLSFVLTEPLKQSSNFCQGNNRALRPGFDS